MDQQTMADLIEIQQLAARYMAFSARKEQERWLEIFTPDGEYNAFGTPYGLADFPLLLKSAPPGQYIGNMPVVDFDGDHATGVQHYVFVDQTSHDMRLGWYNDAKKASIARHAAHSLARQSKQRGSPKERRWLMIRETWRIRSYATL